MAMGAKEGKGSGSGRAGEMRSFFYREQRISVGAPRKCELPKLVEGTPANGRRTACLASAPAEMGSSDWLCHSVSCKEQAQCKDAKNSWPVVSIHVGHRSLILFSSVPHVVRLDAAANVPGDHLVKGGVLDLQSFKFFC